MEQQMKNLSLCENAGQADAKAPKLGFKPLAAKMPRNTTKGTKVQVETNIRKLTIAKNQPIYKYSVQVLYVYLNKDGAEATIEMSKSAKKGLQHEADKNRCQKMYQLAAQKNAALQSGGPYFYDRQASLYTLTQLKTQKICFTESQGISRRPNFVRAEFKLEKVDQSFQSTSNDIAKTVNSCPALADKTALEALNIIVSGPAFENQNVVTIGKCVHYLIDTAGVDIPSKEYSEGGLYSGIGASKSVKTLEGTDKKEPSLYMTTEMKTTLFHPDNWPLVSIFQTYKDFHFKLEANSFAGKRLEKAFVGLEVVLDYGQNKGLGEDGSIMKIRGFGPSAKATHFQTDGVDTTVFAYFQKKYGITLKYPDLFTIEAKGKTGKIHLPAELLILCPSQVVTNDQMINNEQADMIRLSAAKPHLRKSITDTVARKVGLASNNIYGFIKVEDPVKVEGIVLNKPKIVFADNKVANLADPRARIPTDFAKAGKYAIAKELTNWELVFMQREEINSRVHEACAFLHKEYKPNVTIIASSKMHNERLYKSENGSIVNLEPGTVIDHTIVSPVFNEFFLAGAVSRQGTTKTAKFTLVYQSNPGEPMWNIEQLTNDLCYDHQIVFHPVSLPVPLYIAGRYSQRGAMVLAANQGPKFTGGVVDLEKTNKEMGYGGKKLFETRFNA
ncbi:hypothetical protein CAEBREN_01938 [Caenorhabditis brenneri]|uniref:PAZ domain-containing protein n=1 Tax=Caenorhabditis brenneri TaxID=135651 RepID=G0P0F4_CAEBE|nr:hypothetical protein CAEBREN_01938 [Caenorhabditis brenneri]